MRLTPRALATCAALAGVVGCTSNTASDASTDAATDAPDDLADGDQLPDVVRDVVVLPDGEVTPPRPQPGRHTVTIVDTRRVVPSASLPPETRPLNSNNNLDVVRHTDGRVYLVWRTAPDHYASPDAVMYAISSTDETTWRYESRFSLATDLREPRLLSWNNELFLYVARLGTNRLSFDPMGMSFSRRAADGSWSALAEFYRPGFIGWRARVERGTPYLVAYLGGEHIYRFDNIPLDVELLTTSDGMTWRGVNAAMPVVAHGGGSETDFTIGDDGTLFAVTRNEAGDDTGWGSNVCRAPAGDITRWRCHNDPRKFDSPYMFWHDGEAYLIARRNVSFTGNYDLMRRGIDRTAQTVMYQLDYRNRPKRCSLWRYDQATDAIVFMLDLPSRGDTCFPAVISSAVPGEFAVYNYSSDIDGPDVPWGTGQEGPTFIYRSLLRFTPR